MFVACKVSNGLQISGLGKTVVLLGPNKAPNLPNTVPGGRPVKELYGGYAITSGVDKAVWEAWLEANQTSDVVEKKLVFADESLEVLRARAWSRARQTSGFEQATTAGFKPM